MHFARYRAIVGAQPTVLQVEASMNDLAVVKTAVCFLRAMHKRPSASNVAAIMRTAGGHAYRTADLCDLIKRAIFALGDNENGKRAGSEREITGTSPEAILSTAGSVTEKTGSEREDRAREIDLDLGLGLETPVPTKPEGKKRARKTRRSEPFPELPAVVATAYTRLVANDAAERSDGKIADSVVAKNKEMLQFAYEQHGQKALLHGVRVALSKGKGVRYAAGCVRNYDEGEDSLKVPSFRDRPRAVGPFDGPIYTPTAAERDYGIDR
jgi:hypothetical protein